MNAYHHLRRTDLFLVRVWREDAEDAEASTGGSSGSGRTEWCGKVQRVVDGEAHQFNGWQGLVDSLLTMLSHSEGR